MSWLRVLVATILLTCAGAAVAVQPDEVLPDPAMESRARDISREVRCMVCQNQSIDDSDAPLARDLRLLVRERLKAGDSNGEVLDFLTARYGEFVLLRPRFTLRTALLWLLPLALLLIGVGGIFLLGRRYRLRIGTVDAVAEIPRLTPSEEARLAEMTNGPKG